MEPLIVTGFLLAVALLSIFVDRFLQRGRSQRHKAGAQVSQQTHQLSQQPGWRNRLATLWWFRRTPPADLSQHLRAWATTMLTGEEAFQHWLIG